MYGSCYYQNYTGIELKTVGIGKTSGNAEKTSAYKNGIRRVIKTSIDGIDIHLVPSLRPNDGEPLSPPITDSQYNRLHDIRYDTDFEFLATQLERWRIRMGRLASWTPYEQKVLINRWYVHSNCWTHAERMLFSDLANTIGRSTIPSADGVNDHSAAVSMDFERMPSFDVGDPYTPCEASCDNASAGFINSEGKIDSRCCPELIAMWETRANRKRPFPRAVADKLLATWLKHESAWTPSERIIFHAEHDPTVEKCAQISANKKRDLLDTLAPRNDDGSEPLLNGRNFTSYESKPSPDELAEEVLATPLEADSDPTASEYEKELKQFLAANSEADVHRFARSANAAVRKNHRLDRVMKSELPKDVKSLKQIFGPKSPFRLGI